MYKNNVAIYLRKSRMDSDSESIEDTLTRHYEQLLDYAKKNDITIIQVYKEVVSGESLYLRPQMCSLLQGVEQNLYSAILCMDIDRLGRSSQKDSGIIYEALQEHNVFIITPNKTYDLNNAMDELSVDMQSFLARQELKTIKRRLRRGTEKTCQDGYHVTEPPYGYRRCYIDKRPSLEIYEPEAQAVRMVYDWYVNHNLGSKIIAERLNALGYTPRKGVKFSRSTVRFIISNPTYAGQIVWNRQKVKKKRTPDDKHIRIDNDKDKWIVADGVHQAIIDANTFKRAQEIRATRAHPSCNNGVIKNPLSGIIYCAHCGGRMQRQYASRIDRSYLLCPEPGCVRSIPSLDLENYLLDLIREVLSTAAASDKKIKPVDKTTHIKVAIEKLENEKLKVMQQKNALHTFLEQGVYDVNTFLERSQIVSERLNEIESLIKQNLAKLEELQSEKPIQAVIPAMKQLVNEYDSLSAEAKNLLYKKIFKRVTYNRTKDHKGQDFDAEIMWNFAI